MKLAQVQSCAIRTIVSLRRYDWLLKIPNLKHETVRDGKIKSNAWLPRAGMGTTRCFQTRRRIEQVAKLYPRVLYVPSVFLVPNRLHLANLPLDSALGDCTRG